MKNSRTIDLKVDFKAALLKTATHRWEMGFCWLPFILRKLTSTVCENW